MTAHRLLFFYLWIAPAVLQLGILIAMIRHKSYRQFRAFFAYTLFQILAVAYLVTLDMLPAVSGGDWFRAFSLVRAVTTALLFGIIYEVLPHLYRSSAALKQMGKSFFRWCTLAFLLAAVVAAIYTRSNSSDHPMYVMNVLQQTASILQCGLLVSLFVFSAYLGLSWRNYVFGMVLGLGISASVELAAAALRSQLGASANEYLNLLIMGTYHICVLIWIFYLWGPERSPTTTALKLPAHDLEVWNHELERLIQQ